MAGSATLSVWNPDSREVVDIEITWSKGYDEDARMKIPKAFKAIWDLAKKQIEWDSFPSVVGLDPEPVAPYRGLGVSVPLDKLTTSATGAYAILSRGLPVNWKVPPPYPVEAASEKEEQ